MSILNPIAFAAQAALSANKVNSCTYYKRSKGDVQTIPRIVVLFSVKAT
jgi:hypothetical protein